MSVNSPDPTIGPDPNLTDVESLLQYETELVIGRRAFSSAQAAFGIYTGVVRTYSVISASWHDTSVDRNVGSFAVVKTGAGYDDLVGEIIRVSVTTNVKTRSVLVYVVGDSERLLAPLSLYRRAFMAVASLAQYPAGLTAKVQVMQ